MKDTFYSDTSFRALRLTSTYQEPKIPAWAGLLSVVQPLQQNYRKDKIIQKIQEDVHDMTRNLHKEILLIWVPEHTDIQENETASHVAKSTEPDNDKEEEQISVNRTTVRKIIKMQLNTIRLSTWFNTINNKLRQVREDIRQCDSEKTRQEQVTITRLGTGYTKHTHEYLLARLSPKQYDECDEKLTVEHILITCLLGT